jgi:hypothetical protein
VLFHPIAELNVIKSHMTFGQMNKQQYQIFHKLMVLLLKLSAVIRLFFSFAIPIFNKPDIVAASAGHILK